MSDKVKALIEEFSQQIRVAPRVFAERGGRLAEEDAGPVTEKPGDHYGGVRGVKPRQESRHYGSKRAR